MDIEKIVKQFHKDSKPITICIRTTSATQMDYITGYFKNICMDRETVDIRSTTGWEVTNVPAEEIVDFEPAKDPIKIGDTVKVNVKLEDQLYIALSPDGSMDYGTPKENMIWTVLGLEDSGNRSDNAILYHKENYPMVTIVNRNNLEKIIGELDESKSE